MFYGHTSKAWSLYGHSNTRSNDDAVTVKANNVHHRQKYVQLQVGRAILAVQGKGGDSCRKLAVRLANRNNPTGVLFFSNVDRNHMRMRTRTLFIDVRCY